MQYSRSYKINKYGVIFFLLILFFGEFLAARQVYHAFVSGVVDAPARALKIPVNFHDDPVWFVFFTFIYLLVMLVVPVLFLIIIRKIFRGEISK